MQVTAWKKSLDSKVTTLNNFERQLSDEGTIILKFFLHISRDEQKHRLEMRERNPLTAWLVTPAIWNLHRHYDDSLPIIDGFLYETNTEYAPWHIVEATDRDYAVEKVSSTLVKTLENAVVDGKKERSAKEKHTEIEKPKKNPVKWRSIPENPCTKEECDEELRNLQIEMLELQYLLYNVRSLSSSCTKAGTPRERAET